MAPRMQGHARPMKFAAGANTQGRELGFIDAGRDPDAGFQGNIGFRMRESPVGD